MLELINFLDRSTLFMKVLKEGKEIKITCVTCGAKLAITQTDIKPFFGETYVGDSGYVVCPSCNNTIELERSVWTNKWFVRK